MNDRTNSILHSGFFCIVMGLFSVVVTSVSINGIGLNSSQIALAQQQQDQANFTSVEQQQIMDGISFEIDNVTSHIIWLQLMASSCTM